MSVVTRRSELRVIFVMRVSGLEVPIAILFSDRTSSYPGSRAGECCLQEPSCYRKEEKNKAAVEAEFAKSVPAIAEDEAAIAQRHKSPKPIFGKRSAVRPKVARKVFGWSW